MKGKGKLKQNKEYNKKYKSNEEESDEKKYKENSGKSKNKKRKSEYLYPKKNTNYKNKKNKKDRNKEINDTIVKESKEFYNYINEVMEKENKDKENKKEKSNEKIKDNENDIKSKENSKDEENEGGDNNNREKKIDNIFLSSLYDLFEEYDEILIKRDENKKYIINACIKLEKEKEIKFEIIYDKERDYFDYYPNNKNFEFKDEDDPFNYDLDIPKTDFCILIRNFKKYKKK